MNKSVIIIGAGGHSKVIADIILKSNDRILGFIEDNKSNEEIPFGLNKLGKLKDIPLIKKLYPESLYIIAIGDNNLREKISNYHQLNYYTAIHPNAIIGKDVNVGVGSCIMSGVIINPSSNIGNHCIINSGAIIEHDNFISDYAHISPNATLGGGVKIGVLTHIGIGSTIINGVTIGSKVVIGAGAVVINDILESGTYVGVPAKRKLK